jgi:hypothetical protein
MLNLRARLRALAVVAVPLGLASSGCIPPGVAWFPDSSGFVYTGGKEKCDLRIFEVARKKSRPLPFKAGFAAWPAVSPDGKHIAVAWRFTRAADKETCAVVVVVDRAGRVVHRSKDLEEVAGDVLQAYWSPRGDKLLISEEFWARFYDLKTQKWSRAAGPIATFGTSPVRPDGKAFLIHNFEGYRVVNWDGKEQVVAPAWRALIKDDPDKRGLLRLPLHADSDWNGPVARVSGLDSRFRIDTVKLSLTQEAHKTPRTADGGVVRLEHAFPGGATVRLVEHYEELFPGHLSRVGDPRIEVLRPAQAPRVLVPKAGFVKFFPSPDGRLLAVRWGEDLCAVFGESKKQDRIVLLGVTGDTIADLSVGE